MGKNKTQRTEELRQAEQAQTHIEQHNFDRLVAQGVIVKGVPKKDDDPQVGR